MAYQIVSMSDLVRHPLFEDTCDKEGAIDALLYSMGIDIKEDYEVTVCTHRSELTNEVHTCDRYVGEERKDEAWLEIKRLTT